jgi:hypothetical protein
MLAPVEGLYLPDGQFEHTAELEELEYRPTAQVVQVEAAVGLEYPAGHAKQVEAPITSPYVPAEHGEHAAAAAML